MNQLIALIQEHGLYLTTDRCLNYTVRENAWFYRVSVSR